MPRTERERRPKREIKKVALAYAQALKELIPGIEPEIDLEGIAGHDVWVRIPISLEEEELSERITEETAKLAVRFWDETGVMIVTTPTVKESVA